MTPRKPREFTWKLFHGQVNVEKKLKVMRLSDGICKICQTHTEDFEHMVTHCNEIPRIWDKMYQIIQLVKPDFTFTGDIIYFGQTSDDPESNTVINTVISVARWHIWKRRCSNKYDNKLIPIDACLVNIMSNIFEHLTLLCKKPKFCEKTNTIRTWIKDQTV